MTVPLFAFIMTFCFFFSHHRGFSNFCKFSNLGTHHAVYDQLLLRDAATRWPSLTRLSWMACLSLSATAAGTSSTSIHIDKTWWLIINTSRPSSCRTPTTSRRRCDSSQRLRISWDSSDKIPFSIWSRHTRLCAFATRRSRTALHPIHPCVYQYICNATFRRL